MNSRDSADREHLTGDTRHSTHKHKMTVVTEYGQRPPSYSSLALEDRFEVIKDIGDGSFGSVSLARVRGAGSHVARRGTMVSDGMLPLVLQLLTVTRLPSRR